MIVLEYNIRLPFYFVRWILTYWRINQNKKIVITTVNTVYRLDIVDKYGWRDVTATKRRTGKENSLGYTRCVLRGTGKIASWGVMPVSQKLTFGHPMMLETNANQPGSNTTGTTEVLMIQQG